MHKHRHISYIRHHQLASNLAKAEQVMSTIISWLNTIAKIRSIANGFEKLGRHGNAHHKHVIGDIGCKPI